MFKVWFHPLFIVCIIISIALRKMGQFFILFIIITIHELFHILVSKKFHLTCTKWSIIPVGQMASIKNLEFQSPLKQSIILIAGPIINLSMWGIGSSFFISIENSYIHLFIMANFIIGIFNLLPIYPLDGGRILYGWISHYRGNLCGMKKILKMSRYGIFALQVFGMIQIIFYPFNCSLLLVSFYLMYINKKQKLCSTYELYKLILNKKQYMRKKELFELASCTVIDLNTSFLKILQCFSSSRYTIFLVYHPWTQQVQMIFEMDLIDYILKNGVEGTVRDYLQIQSQQGKN